MKATLAGRAWPCTVRLIHHRITFARGSAIAPHPTIPCTGSDCPSIVHLNAVGRLYVFFSRQPLRYTAMLQCICHRPLYLSEMCRPISSEAGRRHLRSADHGQLVVPRYRLTSDDCWQKDIFLHWSVSMEQSSWTSERRNATLGPLGVVSLLFTTY